MINFDTNWFGYGAGLVLVGWIAGMCANIAIAVIGRMGKVGIVLVVGVGLALAGSAQGQTPYQSVSQDETCDSGLAGGVDGSPAESGARECVRLDGERGGVAGGVWPCLVLGYVPVGSSHGDEGRDKRSGDGRARGCREGGDRGGGCPGAGGS